MDESSNVGKKFIKLSTNEKLKVKFRNDYQALHPECTFKELETISPG